MRPVVSVHALRPGENWKLISNGIPSDMSSTYRNDTEISRLRNSFSVVPSTDDSSECHSLDVGHDGRDVYLDAEEK